jgi:hypothetical protein
MPAPISVAFTPNKYKIPINSHSIPTESSYSKDRNTGTTVNKNEHKSPNNSYTKDNKDRIPGTKTPPFPARDLRDTTPQKNSESEPEETTSSWRTPVRSRNVSGSESQEAEMKQKTPESLVVENRIRQMLLAAEREAADKGETLKSHDRIAVDRSESKIIAKARPSRGPVDPNVCDNEIHASNSNGDSIEDYSHAPKSNRYDRNPHHPGSPDKEIPGNMHADLLACGRAPETPEQKTGTRFVLCMYVNVCMDMEQ